MAASSLRESVARNNLLNAREAAKRFPELKDMCKKFISTYENRTAVPDEKHGFKKYMVLLQAAANQRLETVHVDLDDVEEFAKNELLEPDQGIAEARQIPKIQLQQSVEQWIADIECNASRFLGYFYEACDSLLPCRDENCEVDGSSAKEVIAKWRSRMIDQQREAGNEGANSGLPLRLKNEFDVRFKPRGSSRCQRMRELSAEYVGSLVQLDCNVVRTTAVKPRVEVVTYHCEVCDAEIFLTVEGDRFTPLQECPSQRCKDNKQAGKLRQNNRTSKFGKYQEIRVQEMSDHVPVGGVPRAITVVVNGDNTRLVLPGDAVTITGVYKPLDLPWFLARQQGTKQSMYIDCHHFRKHKTGYNEANNDALDISRQVDEAHRSGNLYEQASRSIAPEIFGHADVKKALLLVLIGSFTKRMEDGMKIRGDIHTLLMGDPGVAKSQLVKQVTQIAPRSVYTTGKGTSGVGLTASVLRDPSTGEVTLEGGALVLADMGICCIDEFDKMEESDRTAIHEVMEQQTVSIAKAGITTTLNCRTTVLAAANPLYGRYNPFKSPVENINLPPALLSRFDLLFLLLDTVDREKDMKLAKHVCKVHTVFDQSGAKEKKGDPDDNPLEDIYEFKPFSADFMRSYIRKAKSFTPLIQDDLCSDIVDTYVAVREDEKNGDRDTRKSYTTPRTLLAMLRLSQAHARARLSDRVSREDFDEAMRLIKVSKESVEMSAPVKKNANPLDMVYDIVSDLCRGTNGEEIWVEVKQVINMAGHKTLDAEMVEEAIINWESLSVMIRTPDKSLVKFTVPDE